MKITQQSLMIRPWLLKPSRVVKKFQKAWTHLKGAKKIKLEKHFILVHLSNGISTTYGLFNPKIWFIWKCFIVINYIFNFPLHFFFNLHTIMFSSNLPFNNNLFAQLYDKKYSYLITSNIYTIIWFKVIYFTNHMLA